MFHQGHMTGSRDIQNGWLLSGQPPCMATKVEHVITEIGIEKIRAAGTDTASGTVRALSILAGKYSRIAVYTCAAHTLRLIIGDITKLK